MASFPQRKVYKVGEEGKGKERTHQFDGMRVRFKGETLVGEIYLVYVNWQEKTALVGAIFENKKGCYSRVGSVEDFEVENGQPLLTVKEEIEDGRATENQ